MAGNRRWQSSRSFCGCLTLNDQQSRQSGVEFVAGIDEVTAARVRTLLRDDGYEGNF